MDINSFLQQFMPQPNSNWGTRQDGSAKGTGWLGQIPMAGDPKTLYPEQMSELSADVTIGGKNISFPLIVPTLTPQEIIYLRLGKEPTQNIYRKAISFALEQLKQGKSPYKGE
jgi:hypothetical protein